MQAHITYRDAILLLHPDTALPDDFAQRLRALRISRHKRPVTEEWINELREMANRYCAHRPDFYTEHMSICFNITVLVSRLENMRDFQQDMRMRLGSRLRGVRMLQKWDERDKAWVWILELNEDVQEGLGQGDARLGRRNRNRNRAGKDASNSNDDGAIGIDG
jgi:hypothetical protein